jgi:MoaA/NifB/PqqE/SkfB family radical SAM enzyme
MKIIYPPEPEPVRLEIEPTNICNFNCVFCPREYMKRKEGFMSISKFRDFLDRFEDYRKKNVVK